MGNEIVLDSEYILSVVDDDIAICNLALLKMGNADNYITTFDDSTKEARACRRFYTHVINLCIDDYPWNCMVKQAQLNRSETAPIFGYDYAYEVPDDCLRILSVSADGIHDEQYGVDWRRVGAYIYTNVETLYAMYLWNNTDVGSYDPRFIEAIATRLAIELRPSLGSVKSLAELWAEYDKIVEPLKLADAVEGKKAQRNYGELITVR